MSLLLLIEKATKNVCLISSTTVTAGLALEYYGFPIPIIILHFLLLTFGEQGNVVTLC